MHQTIRQNTAPPPTQSQHVDENSKRELAASPTPSDLPSTPFSPWLITTKNKSSSSDDENCEDINKTFQ